MLLRATGDYYDERLIPGASIELASRNQWILPRANQVSPGHLVAPVCPLVPPFRILVLPTKPKTPAVKAGVWFGRVDQNEPPLLLGGSIVGKNYKNKVSFKRFLNF